MSTLKLFRVAMLMPRGGKTFVVVGAMGRAHAIQVAKSEHPDWHPTGEAQELS